MNAIGQRDRQRIEKAVMAAERKTSGEIVPVIIPAAVSRRLLRLFPERLLGFYTRYRARRCFFELGIHKTAGHTGIVIVVFLQERRVEVVADKGISAQYPQKTWEELVLLIVRAAKKGQLVAGLCTAILRCGKILGAHCPRQKNDRNELPDRLHLRD